MYNLIDPRDNTKINLFSKKGIQLLKKYLQTYLQLTGGVKKKEVTIGKIKLTQILHVIKKCFLFLQVRHKSCYREKAQIFQS